MSDELTWASSGSRAGSARGRPRTLLQRAVDSAFTWLLRLPPATAGYTVTRDMRIPMRDGAVLLADLFEPDRPAKGTILVRSPYGWGLLYAAMSGGVFASRGYNVVLARCRGTFGSGGEFEPFVNEADDGADTVSWMRGQPWFGGRFAMYGASYVGFTQWVILSDPPPELVTCVVSTAPHDFRASMYRGGAFALDTCLSWSERTSRQEVSLPRLVLDEAIVVRRLREANMDLPLVDAGTRLMGTRAPWYRTWATSRDLDAPFWRGMIATEALDRVQVPLLLQAGWHDIFLDQMFEQYERLARRGADVALTVGPWTHGGYLAKGGPIVVREALEWFDEHFTRPAGKRAAPVRAFVAGAAGEWFDLPQWPPQAGEAVLSPQPGGGLGVGPAADGESVAFTFDPANPTPSVGGQRLMAGGYVDDTALAQRPDVVSFTGPPLTEPLRVLGTPRAELAHATDNPHADLFVRLSEVDPAGRSRNVTDGFVRLAPEAANGPVRIDLDPTGYEFAAGNRIRLLVAGGCHPRWERNLGTGKDPAMTADMAVSRRRLDLASSRLVLPVVAR